MVTRAITLAIAMALVPEGASACTRLGFDAGMAGGFQPGVAQGEPAAGFGIEWQRCDVDVRGAVFVFGARLGFVNRGHGSTLGLGFVFGVASAMKAETFQWTAEVLVMAIGEDDRSPEDARGLLFGFGPGARLDLGYALDDHTRLTAGTTILSVIGASDYWAAMLGGHLAYAGEF